MVFDCSQPDASVRGFPRLEYWSGLPFLPSGDLPNPGIEPRSPALQADSLPLEPPGIFLNKYRRFIEKEEGEEIKRNINEGRAQKSTHGTTQRRGNKEREGQIPKILPIVLT